MDNIEQKQEYLRTNIIDLKYDPEEFVEYCQTVKGEVDLESWTLAEVIKIVDQFVKTKNQSTIKPLDNQLPDPFGDAFASTGNNFGRCDEFSKLGQGNTRNKVEQTADFGFHFQQATVVPVAFNPVDFDFLTGSFKVQGPKISKAVAIQNDLDAFNNMGSIQQQKQQKKSLSGNSTLGKQQSYSKTQPKSTYNDQPQTHSKQLQSPTKKQVSVPIKTGSNPTFPQQALSSPNQSKQQIKGLETIRQKIQCRKINPKLMLYNTNPCVLIDDHQIVSPSMFLPNYVLYTVKVNPIGLEVKRKYKDFQVLREILGKLFPMTRLPFLNGNNRLSETEETAIKKQKYMLESFLNDILINKEFLTCKVVEEFLTMKDESMFKKRFKQYQKLGQIKSLEELATHTGTYELVFTDNHYQFCQKVPAFINIFEAYQQKVRNLYQQLSSSIQLATKIMMDISHTFSGLQQIVQNFNNSSAAVETMVSLESTYQSLGDLHKQWALSFGQQMELIDNNVRPGLKFDKENVTSTMKELFKTRNNITETYLKRAQKEPITEKYTSTKLESFKTQLVYPSKNITVLKYQNAFVNSKLTSEVGRLFRQLSQKMERRYGIMGKLQSNISLNTKITWDNWAKKSP